MTHKEENFDTPQGILDGLETLLGMVENSDSFNELLKIRFGKKGAKALKNVMRYGSVNASGFRTLSSINPEEFEEFLREADFSKAGKELGIDIPDYFINTASSDFRLAIIECLTRYKIFECFYIQGTDRYKQLCEGKGFEIYFDPEDGWHYLKLGKNFIPDENLRDDYFKEYTGYLFFIDRDKTYCFDYESGKLIELTGEYIESYIFSGKTYIQIAFPNQDNPTEYNIHCIEDDYTYTSFVKNSVGRVHELTEVNSKICLVTSAQIEYTGVRKGEKVEKAKRATQVRDIYTGEIVIDSDGVFESIKSVDEVSVLLTKRLGLIGNDFDTARHIPVEQITRLNGHGEVDFSHYIDEESIIERIDTSRDTIYIFQGTDNSICIFSPFRAIGVGSTFGPQEIIEIESINRTENGVEIIYVFKDKSKGLFISGDYPSLTSH